MVEYAFKALIMKRTIHQSEKVQEKDLCSNELCNKSKGRVSLKS